MNRYTMRIQGLKDQVVPLHANTEMEIVYVRQGSINVIYDEYEYTLTEGQAMVILPCRPHSYTAFKDTDSRVFMFSYGLVNETLGNISYLAAKRDIFKLSEALAGYIDSIVLPLEGSIEVTNTYLINSVYYSLLNAYLTDNSLMACKKNYIVQQVIEIVTAETERTSIDDIAKRLGISRKTLTAKFAEYTGSAIRDFIKNMRLEKAGDMLSYTDNNISEIAFQCGYGSIRSFNRDFYEVFKSTPSQFRQKASGSDQG